MLSNQQLRIRVQDLLDAPTPRVPVALCLDVSGSMSGAPIQELNEGVKTFFAELKQDLRANRSAEVAMVAFADRAETVLDFQSLDHIPMPPEMVTGSYLGNSTNLGAGVDLALQRLNQRKAEYQSAGVEYFQPFLVIMTDGQPTTSTHLHSADQVRQYERDRKLVVMPIGIGPHADMGVLATFSSQRAPLRLRGLCFAEFFRWLSKSVVKLSQSMPGETFKFDAQGLKGWAEI